MTDLSVEARQLAKDLSEGHYAMSDAVAMINRLVIQTEGLQALADELATFLTDEEHGEDGMSGDDGASNLGAFIQQARGLSVCRPKEHARSCECGACPERS